MRKSKGAKKSAPQKKQLTAVKQEGEAEQEKMKKEVKTEVCFQSFGARSDSR